MRFNNTPRSDNCAYQYKPNLRDYESGIEASHIGAGSEPEAEIVF